MRLFMRHSRDVTVTAFGALLREVLDLFPSLSLYVCVCAWLHAFLRPLTVDASRQGNKLSNARHVIRVANSSDSRMREFGLLSPLRHVLLLTRIRTSFGWQCCQG